MIYYNVLVYCVLILFAEVVISNEVKRKTVKYSDDDVRNTFDKLLKKIVKVNEERMQAMEKMTRLQDYMLTKNKLKTDDDDDDYDSSEEEDNRVLLTLADLPLLRRLGAEKIARAKCNRYLEKNNVHLWTRQFLKQACRSHSERLCKQTCIKFVIEVCERVPCNIRRELNTQCQKNCMRNILKNLIYYE